jgi:ABC-type nickel/cobalt efflux system permease component RcnA
VLRADNPLVFRLLILALMLALVLILAHAAWLVWRTVRGARAADAAAAPSTAAERRDADWYGRAADRAAGEGRIAEALQLAFVALALSLDRQGLLQYHASKTPAECARDARLVPADRERLRGLVRTLYLHAFGGRPAALDDYRHWRAAGAEPWHAPAG